jgi:hypothetical protein
MGATVSELVLPDLGRQAGNGALLGARTRRRRCAPTRTRPRCSCATPVRNTSPIQKTPPCPGSAAATWPSTPCSRWRPTRCAGLGQGNPRRQLQRQQRDSLRLLRDRREVALRLDARPVLRGRPRPGHARSAARAQFAANSSCPAGATACRAPQVAGTPDGLQIAQDTGSGGSWPVSTDRITWAFAAEEVLKSLPPAERQAFAATALKACRTPSRTTASPPSIAAPACTPARNPSSTGATRATRRGSRKTWPRWRAARRCRPTSATTRP